MREMFNDLSISTAAVNRTIAEKVMGWIEKDGHWCEDTGYPVYRVWPTDGSSGLPAFCPVLDCNHAVFALEVWGEPVSFTYVDGRWTMHYKNKEASEYTLSVLICAVLQNEFS